MDLMKVTNLHRNMEECSKLISDTKYNYLNNLGNKLNDPFLGLEKYWPILNTFLNKKKDH